MMIRSVKTALVCLGIFASVVSSAHTREERRQQWRENNPNRFSMNFSLNGTPQTTTSLFSSNIYQDISSSSGIVSSLYRDYRGNIVTSGTFGAEFNWNISRWFNASGYLGLCPVWTRTYDGVTDALKDNRFGMAIFVMPKAKVMWCNTPLVRVYSSVALGAAFYPGVTKSGVVKAAGQMGLAGLEIGRKGFVSMELGFGTVYTGGQIGFGFKF